ncbi:MAG: hypothetical protein QW625_02580 [Candidatus Nanoarchaeia archaeon]
MNKKGITNIEMITAATIFIFCVVIVIYYISFIGLREEPSNIFLDILEQNLRNESEISYKTIYLAVNSQGAADCFNVSVHSDMSQDKLNNFITENGAAVAFDVQEEWFLINNHNNQQSHNFTIYSFPFNVTAFITPSPSDCMHLIKGQHYNYSISYEDKIFVYENLTKWFNDYKGLKDKWKFSRDFIINVTYGSSSFSIGAPMKAIEAPIKARTLSIKMIDESGAIFDAIINLQVW